MSSISLPGIPQLPECVAIVICNEVIEDKRTNNKSLIGLFNRIVTSAVPTLHGTMCILVSVTDGRGEAPFAIQLEGPSGQSLFRAEGRLHFPDPLKVIDVVVEVRGLPLPEVGEYYVGFYCYAQRLGSRRFIVDTLKERKMPVLDRLPTRPVIRDVTERTPAAEAKVVLMEGWETAPQRCPPQQSITVWLQVVFQPAEDREPDLEAPRSMEDSVAAQRGFLSSLPNDFADIEYA